MHYPGRSRRAVAPAGNRLVAMSTTTTAAELGSPGRNSRLRWRHRTFELDQVRQVPVVGEMLPANVRGPPLFLVGDQMTRGEPRHQAARPRACARLGQPA